MYRETKRKFDDVETGRTFTLFMDDDTHEYKLYYLDSKGNDDLANGSEVNGFYICAHTPCTIKLNGKKEVYLPQGTFYNMKEGEKITHKKFIGFDRFVKV